MSKREEKLKTPVESKRTARGRRNVETKVQERKSRFPRNIPAAPTVPSSEVTPPPEPTPRKEPIKVVPAVPSVPAVPAEEPIKVTVNETPTSSRGSGRGSEKLKSQRVIDHDIKEWGYSSVHRIDLPDGKTYVKARSPLGFFIFVDVGNEKYAGTTKHDLVMEKVDSLPISNTIKRGVADDLSTTDAIILCQKGMCRLERNPRKIEPNETNFSIVSPDPDGSFMNETVTAFPVISYAVLKDSKDHGLSLTLEATIRTRRSMMDRCEQTDKTFAHQLDKLCQESSKFINDKKSVVKKLSKSLGKLTNEWADPPSGTKELYTYNLSRLNDLTVSYFGLCQQIQEYNDKFENIRKSIEALNELLSTEFVDLDSLIEPPMV